MATTQHITKVGDRIVYTYNRPYRGSVPGTVKKITKGRGGVFVTVAWDDGTTTKTDVDFINKNTKEFTGWF